MDDRLQRDLLQRWYAFIMLLSDILVAIFAGAILWKVSGGDPYSSDTATSPAASPREVIVQTNTDWQNSGVSLQYGDPVSIRYLRGGWTTWNGTISPGDANGPVDSHPYICAEHMTASLCEEPVPNAQKGALVARIGDNGIPFLVGNELDFTAGNTGTLWLGINDGPSTASLSDNTGSVAISIAVQPSPRPPSPAWTGTHGTVAVGGANVFRSPDAPSRIIRILSEGTSIRVLCKVNGGPVTDRTGRVVNLWYALHPDGYVAYSVVSLEVAESQVPLC
jgi:hypothetical protein